jgi:predicted nucleotidyltransferase
VFSPEEREQVRQRLLEAAEADPGVVGAAFTGSVVAGAQDDWSDIDLALGIDGELAPALERWAELLDRDFGALHHWDLPWGSSVYRVFLLPGWLEVDIAFTPAADFGPRGPNWRTVFGETVDVAPNAPVPQDELVGLAWHHVLHARACVERGKPWQAEWLISALRDHVLSLGCLRLGHITRFAKGADLLPPELAEPVEAALVRSLDETELRRALAAATEAFAAELERVDPALAAALQPMLAEVGTMAVMSNEGR